MHSASLEKSLWPHGNNNSMDSVCQLLIGCVVRSKHEEILLVPVEQFYEEASEDISKPVSCIFFVCISVEL